MKFIYFNSRDELIRLPINSIVYFESDGNYTNVVTINKLRSTIGMTLGDMEKALASQLGPVSTIFIRIGKRYIVNRNFIYKFNIQKQMLVLSDLMHFAFQLSISKEALKNMKQLLMESKNNKGTNKIIN